MSDHEISIDRETWEEIIEAAAAKAAVAVIESQGQGGPVMRKAWVYQDDGQVKKYGEDSPKLSYYVGWRDPNGVRHGKSCGPGPKGKRLAAKEAERIHAELVTGTYGKDIKKAWSEFRAEYERTILSGKAASTRRQVLMSLRNFERIVKPNKVSAVTTNTVDTFIAARRQEKVRYRRSDRAPTRERKKPYAAAGFVSEASVNVDLRNLKVALAVAVEWGYLSEMPKVRFLQESERLPTYVLPDDFDRLYACCDAARLPDVQGVLPADWWQCFLTVGFLTGWRVGELLGFRRTEADLKAGVARLWNRKAKREDLLPLHPLVIDALNRMASFAEAFFPWPHDRRTLDADFARIQAKAGIPGKYSFHDLRRAFGTLNADKPPKVLQHLMRHRAFATTMKFYQNPMAEIEQAVEKLYVPKGLRSGTEG